MGMFSWLCNVCEMPIMNKEYTSSNILNHVTVFTPYTEEDKVSGIYDGYGRASGITFDRVEGQFEYPPRIEVFHTLCYTVASKLENFEDYRFISKSDPKQGFRGIDHTEITNTIFKVVTELLRI